MKARAFAYKRVCAVDEAIAAFLACEGEARYLAGGQSLLAALNLRLDAPDLLIDIGRIEALKGVRPDGDGLRIGALTPHAEILRSPLVAQRAPLLRKAAAFVAHPAVRNRGTIGGSLALADPVTEFPACALALDAKIEIAGLERTRAVPADDFFHDLYETALQPGEILTAIVVPPPPPGARAHFDEFARRRGDYALVGLATQAVFDGGRVSSIRLAFSAMGATQKRARAAEDLLAGGALDAGAIAAARDALDRDLEPDGDEVLAASTRMHLARVLLGRSLAAVAEARA